LASSVERLDQVWQNPTGWARLTAVNHRAIGIRYIVTGFVFFLLAVGLALAMVIQLSRAEQNILSEEMYNQFFTMHGTTMMFLFAVPIMEGFAIYVVPLMIGARDAAFPRLNAFGYYVYLISGLTLFFALFIGQAPDSGWFNYVPLSGPAFSPGLGIDFWATAITFLEIAALVAAVEIIVTILRLRAPGMSINRIPVFVWAMLTMAFMIVLAMPPLMVASVMLALDRMVATAFFDVAAGGNVLLWQHLFWWFGHPEVYIIAIPAFGMVSAIIPAFVRRPLVGHTAVVLAVIVIGIVSFALWVHHMFATGESLLGMSFFAAASMAIAIPSGIQVFAWIGTIWTGPRIVWATPFLWVVGFLLLFVIGGITGVMLAAIPFDWQVHDTQFVTAHFHYVLIGGAVFPLMGAFYFWWPKITGRMMSERLGKISFALAFVGFNVAFFHMHFTGFAGMPRRVASYMAYQGWDTFMFITMIGAFILASGFLLTAANAVWSFRSGPPAGDNPWGAGTLEWQASSPPANYNFEVIPAVTSREPLWEWRERGEEYEREAFDLGYEYRETLGSSVLDAVPQQRIILPGPSLWPLFAAFSVGLLFIGAIAHLIFVPIGGVLTAASLIGWHWPGSNWPWKAMR
jgi:cytochrome c oxidase subunit I+III